LKQLVGNPDALLEAAGIAGTLRAENLSVKDFARLALVYERAAALRA
jgi:16S rRNA (adenine1518-N6/adenine1519-N6)-dimethyltransferase